MVKPLVAATPSGGHAVARVLTHACGRAGLKFPPQTAGQPGGLWALALNHVREESREELTGAGRQSYQCAFQAADGSV